MRGYVRRPWVYSVAVHGLVLGLTVLSFGRGHVPQAVPQPVAIQATVVDAGRIREEAARLDEARQAREQAEQRRRQQEQDQRERQEAEAAAARKREQDRQAEVKRQAELKVQQENQRIAAEAEASKQAEIKAAQQAEADRLAQIEAQRKQEAQRVAAAERARKEAADRVRRDAANQAQAEREAELLAQLEAEASRMRAEESGLLAQYKAMIQQKVQRNWLRPPDAAANFTCEVRVTQVPGGAVVSVKFGACDADALVKRSIEAAVFKASPLPAPPDPSLFDRNIIFRFNPGDD